jgi:DNA mismatch repair protein MutL
MAERTIHILPETIASQIAAGEVVERPASAVKEMVENALDAGAKAVSVEIARGGAGLIAVADDGCGMSREDAILSIRRHATSKIRDAADLRAIRTFGFRGEALAAIASVSHLELKARTSAADGVHLSVIGGELVAARACAMAPGTRIEARDLFYNTPARLKFLKTIATEQSAVAEAIQRLALANPAVAFSLQAEGRRVLDLPRASGLLERVRQLFGARFADRLLPFELARDAMKCTGLAATSQESYPTPRMVFTFVNHRGVRDRMLIRAVAQAYATLIPRGRHPGCVLFVELRPDEVDVNVHPMKTEVRFRRSSAVFDLVYHALHDRLADQVGRQVDRQADSVDARSAADASAAAIPDHVIDGGPAAGAIHLAAEDAGVADSAGAALARIEGAGPRRLSLVPDNPARIDSDQRRLGLGYGGAGISDGLAREIPAPARAPSPIPRYSELRLIGQLFAGFIVLEDDEGLILIDQHAAHERVTFEKLRGQLRSGAILVQSRLVPETVELVPARAARIQAAIPELRALGFEVEAFGDATLLLKGAPAVFGPEAGARLLAEMIETIGDSAGGMRGEEAFEQLLKQLACHGSVRAGRVLEESEIRELLTELDRTEFKTNCPHGRPVHIRFPRGQIERMFRR